MFLVNFKSLRSIAERYTRCSVERLRITSTMLFKTVSVRQRYLLTNDIMSAFVGENSYKKNLHFWLEYLPTLLPNIFF